MKEGKDLDRKEFHVVLTGSDISYVIEHIRERLLSCKKEFNDMLMGFNIDDINENDIDCISDIIKDYMLKDGQDIIFNSIVHWNKLNFKNLKLTLW